MAVEREQNPRKKAEAVGKTIEKYYQKPFIEEHDGDARQKKRFL